MMFFRPPPLTRDKWLPNPPAHEVCAHFELSEPARELLEQQMSATDFLERLYHARLFDDALALCAHGVPPRHAIWWGCLCLWEVYRPKPPAPIEKCLAAVIRWVREPSDANRRAAGYVADEILQRYPWAGAGVLLAQAVVLSEGSLAPPEQKAVPPPAGACANLVLHALQTAAFAGASNRLDQCREHFIYTMLQVGVGRLPWDPFEKLTDNGGGR